MDYKMVFKELTYNELKVLIYCLTHKTHTAQAFGSWLSMKYTSALDAWSRARKGLESKGYIVDGQWTKKAMDIVQGRTGKTE